MELQPSFWRRGTRWYYFYLCQDLFENWTLVRVWGDSLSRRGGKKEHLCQSYEDAQKLYDYSLKRRKAHKYQEINC